MRFIFTIVLVLSTINIVQADDWISVAKSDSSTNIELFYSPASFENISTNIHRILVRQSGIDDRQNMKDINYTVHHIDYPADVDCSQRRWKMYPGVIYLRDGRGTVSEQGKNIVTYTAIESGTLADSLRKAVCLEAFRRKK